MNMEVSDNSIKSGFNKLDEMTGGFHKSELIFIGAYVFSDPFYFLISCIKNVILTQTGKTLYFTFESVRDNVNKYLIYSISGISIRQQTGKKYSPVIKECLKTIQNTKIIDCEYEYPIEKLKLLAEYYVKEEGCNIIFIDILQYIGSRIYMDRDLVLYHIISELKNLAQNLNVPIVCIYYGHHEFDSNTLFIKENRLVRFIKQNADEVILIYKKKMWGKNILFPHYRKEIVVVKNKNGLVGHVNANYYSIWPEYIEIPQGFEDIRFLDDCDVKKLLQNVEIQDLARALVGADTVIQEKIFHNLSGLPLVMLKEDMEFIEKQNDEITVKYMGKIAKELERLKMADEIVIHKSDSEGIID